MAVSKTPTSFLSSRFLCLTAILSAICCFTGVTSVPREYSQKRSSLIHSEQALRTGGDGSSLSPNERLVDDIMMKEKRALIEATRLNGSDFAARYNFLNLTARAAMEATKAYKIIRKMPKGGVLHVHDESMTSTDWLVKNVTYREKCFMCVDSSYNVKFHFYNTPPSDPACVWRLVNDYRRESGNVTAFDQSLFNNISMITPDPARAYPDITAVWKRFKHYFKTMTGLMLYAPVFEDYLWEGLRQFRDDNVQYLEIRAVMLPVYELDGTTHTNDWVLALYRRVIGQFVQHYPDFTGARIIKCALRIFPADQILNDIKEAMRLYANNSDFMVGFDLVDQEDPSHPLIFYIDDLLYPSRQNPPVHLPYFFHAGETDWEETASDYNLVDAVLLNTTRIGHGFALYKHPLLMERMRHRGIAVEVNPISNQVLKLVEDPRNHPAASLIASNFPLVISSDDPASWGATPLSHDFYVTFMALTGEQTGLATLKQLAMNSIKYSALTASEKEKAINCWRTKWNSFISEVIGSEMIGSTPGPEAGGLVG